MPIQFKKYIEPPVLTGDSSEGDVLSGKTFYQDSFAKKTGTMPIYSGVTSITENGTVAVGGKYVANDLTVDIPAPTVLLQDKTAIPTTSEQSIIADEGYDGLNIVTVGAIQVEEKTTTINGDITPSSGKYLSKVTVNVPEQKIEQSKNVALDMADGNQTITPDDGTVMTEVTIEKPATMLPENIKKDIVIGGVTGALEAGGAYDITAVETGNTQTLAIVDSQAGGGSGSVAITGAENITCKANSALASGDTVYIISGNGTIQAETSPTSLPPMYCNGVAFNNDGTRCAVGHSGSPFIAIYDTTTTPWTKIANPSTLPTGSGRSVAFNNDGTRCAVAHDTLPFITIYDTTTTPWTKIANPSTLPTARCFGVAFNNDGTRCAVGHETSPFITIYDTTTTPWTKIANPSTLPTGIGRSVAFNNDGTRCAVGHETSPFITIYDTTTTPWTKIANPSTLPTGTGRSVAFNNDGTRCAVAHIGSPFITIYDTTTTPWTKISNPSTLPTGTAYGVAFNNDDTRCAVGHYSSPFITIYDIVNGTPIALAANNTLSGYYTKYGYAKGDIAQGATGTISKIFG